jgi:hypothetical protein
MPSFAAIKMAFFWKLFGIAIAIVLPHVNAAPGPEREEDRMLCSFSGIRLSIS